MVRRHDSRCGSSTPLKLLKDNGDVVQRRLELYHAPDAVLMQIRTEDHARQPVSHYYRISITDAEQYLEDLQEAIAQAKKGISE